MSECAKAAAPWDVMGETQVQRTRWIQRGTLQEDGPVTWEILGSPWGTLFDGRPGSKGRPELGPMGLRKSEDPI